MSKRIPIFIGFIFVCIAVFILLTSSGPAHEYLISLESLGYDLQLATRIRTEHNVPNPSIAIIDIDDQSLKAEGEWPWSYGKLAALVDALQKQGAAVIAFDMFFAEKENNIADEFLRQLEQKKLLTPDLTAFINKNKLLFAEETLFAKSLAGVTSVLAIGFLPHTYTENILPPPLLRLSPSEQKELSINKALGFISNVPIFQQAAKGNGFLNIFPDSDGIIRRAPLLIDYQGGIYPALALQTVLSFLSENITLFTPSYNKTKQLEGIKMGPNFIPTDEKGQVLIPFIGKSYTFPYYSATDVLHGHVPKDALLGKILFIGTSATGLGDLKTTAIQNPFPGVEIQATVTNGILQNYFSYVPAWALGANLVLTILLGILAAWFFPYFGPRLLTTLIIFIPPCLLLIHNFIWTKTGLIISTLLPIILILTIALFNLIYGYLFETRRRERLREMFGQYVPEQHIEAMLKSKSSYALGGEDREMSVLFADIRNFSSMSEGLSATELVELLNTFFTPMTEIIFKHRGTVDKYVGDLVMAFWGAPLKDKNHARNAIESALEMRSMLRDMHKTLAHHHWPEIKMGIGINSGLMSVGDMGSRYRRNYTVLGDAVNLASRIEGLTKYYGIDIIVTETTAKNQPFILFRQLDKVRVRGKKAGVTIYEVVSTQAEATVAVRDELMLYHQALSLYFSQQWDASLAIFTQLSETYPSKKLYQIYRERLKEFKSHPPAKDWDGIFAH